ncbi:MAG: TIM barrel protein [Opitutaceae bacterium]
MNLPLSLSSCWLSHRHQDGYAMLKEIADMGFSHVELSHGVRITLVPGIIKAVEDGIIKVSSCHNFCPLPAGVIHPAPNLFEPSSQDHREQDQWLRNTKRSIDLAAQVKARVLVCHLGSVVFFWFNPARKLRYYMRSHPQGKYADDPKYISVRDAALAKMRKRMPRFVETLESNRATALEYAKQRGIAIGCENRERFDELPLDGDFEALFSALPPDSPVGYWHDTGHADLKENMALLNHREHLTRNAPRLIGFHLHDVSSHSQDHQAIGSGRIDFKMVSEFWRPGHILVLELSPHLGPEEVLSSKRYVESLLKTLP